MINSMFVFVYLACQFKTVFTSENRGVENEVKLFYPPIATKCSCIAKTGRGSKVGIHPFL